MTFQLLRLKTLSQSVLLSKLFLFWLCISQSRGRSYKHRLEFTRDRASAYPNRRTAQPNETFLLLQCYAINPRRFRGKINLKSITFNNLLLCARVFKVIQLFSCKCVPKKKKGNKTIEKAIHLCNKGKGGKHGVNNCSWWDQFIPLEPTRPSYPLSIVSVPCSFSGNG